MSFSGLVVSNLTKRFGDFAWAAVADVSFQVASGEFFTMLGPSGCGKTTTLRMIAGLEQATSGEILLDGKDYTAVPARSRNIGMVFQSYALFPHLPVFENVAYGLRVRKTPAPELKSRVDETLSLLGLADLARRLPSQLSGGQQQRVSLARALVYRPKLLLLDEPLANLDAKLRVQMREEIRRVQRALGIMVLYVTHDQEEAMAVSDRIAIFNQGRLMQVGAPSAIYAEPDSIFAADFIGQANFIPVARDGETAILHGGARIRPGRRVAVARDEWNAAAAPGGALLMVRPERLRAASSAPALRGVVRRIQPLGAMTRYSIDVEGLAAMVTMDLPSPLEGVGEGALQDIGFHDADTTLFALRDA